MTFVKFKSILKQVQGTEISHNPSDKTAFKLLVYMSFLFGFFFSYLQQKGLGSGFACTHHMAALNFTCLHVCEMVTDEAYHFGCLWEL